jgi:hypothetical protein
VKIEAMSPEQTAVVLDGSARSTSLPTPTIVTAPSVGNQPTGLPLSELVEQFYADKEGEAHESGGGLGGAGRLPHKVSALDRDPRRHTL